MTGQPARVRITPTTTTRHFSKTATAIPSKPFTATVRGPAGSIDHVAIRVSDLEASTVFYWTIADAVGLTDRRQTADSATFALDESERSFIVIAGEPSQNAHIAFSGNDDEVRRFHAEATAAGYRSNGEPGERDRYHPGYYAAYVLDPDGNNIEVVNHHR